MSSSNLICLLQLPHVDILLSFNFHLPFASHPFRYNQGKCTTIALLLLTSTWQSVYSKLNKYVWYAVHFSLISFNTLATASFAISFVIKFSLSCQRLMSHVSSSSGRIKVQKLSSILQVLF